MDIESAHWSDWETRFMALAETAQRVEDPMALSEASRHLCLYGDNGFEKESEELLELAQFEEKARLKKRLIETSYWQDIVLYY
jgi:hypothetical protein